MNPAASEIASGSQVSNEINRCARTTSSSLMRPILIPKHRRGPGGGPVPLRRNVRRNAIWFLRGGAAQPVLPGAQRRGGQFRRRGTGPPHSRPGDRKERFGPVAVFLRPVLLGAALFGLREPLFGVAQLLFELAAVEVLGRDRLLEQEAGAVAVDLQPAVGLRVAHGLRVGDV